MNATPMTKIIFSAFLSLFLILAGPSWALEENKPYQVIHVIDGDTIVLEGEQKVRLVGINAPEVEVAEYKHKAQPFGQEAKNFLEDFIEFKPVTVTLNPTQKRDRYGRWLAYLTTADGQFVQERLLKEGYAYVYGFKDARARLPELLKAEEEAITAQRGLWKLPYHAIMNSADLTEKDQRFHIIDGTIQQVAVVKGNAYLNFGDDWKTDFTIFIPKEYIAETTQKVGDLKALKGKQVRVRGHVFRKDGPMIELTVPELLQVK